MLGLNKKKGEKKITLMDLENKKQKSKLDISKSRNKEMKPVTIYALRVVRIIFYSLLILIMVVGVFQLIVSKQPRITKNVVEYNFAESENETAKAFATTFSKEYLTYDSTKGSEYYSRISPFLISALRNGVRVESSKGSSKVIDAIVWSVERLNKEHSNIVVRATVQTENNVDLIEKQNFDGTITKTPKVEQKVIYLSVPVGVYNGGYIVEDYPTFLPEPPGVDNANLDTFTGNDRVMENVKEDVNEVISNFFTTYAQGNEGQIAYYMKDNIKIKGYQGKYLFNGINTLDVYKKNKDENNVIAVVNVGMKDAELGTVFVQRFIFDMTKQQEGDTSRWYINEFTNRGNLYQEGE